MRWMRHLNREAQYGGVSRGDLLHESVFQKLVSAIAPDIDPIVLAYGFSFLSWLALTVIADT